MKLSEIGTPNPQEFEFIDPYTEQPTGIFITVHSIKSKHGKQVTQAMQHTMLELRKNEANLIDGDVKPELVKEATIGWVADLVDSWRGVEDDNGKKIKPSKEAFIEAFTQSDELLDAVYKFASTIGNFTKA